MIDATELRIGNWIRFKGEAQRWDLQHFCALQKSWFEEIVHIEPIALEPATLEKYTYSKKGQYYFLDEQESYYLVWDSNEAVLCKGLPQTSFRISKVEHVHQLQNLYHAITNKELMIL